MNTAPALQRAAYLLGHSPEEQQRLIAQAGFIGGLTAQLFRDAGLQKGMQVLDVGCGVGDVSMLAASMVGRRGRVLGVDQSADAIDAAWRRAADTGTANVRFICDDLLSLELDKPVDVLVGRLVLLYFADPSALLRRLVRYVKPGGLVVFQEIDMEALKAQPRCELLELTGSRLRETFTRAGIDICTALRLGPIFEGAGLPSPQITAGARVERGAHSPIYDYVAGVARTLLPAMERFGVATAQQVDIDTLAARLRDEALARDASTVSPSFIGAWVRVPDDAERTM